MATQTVGLDSFLSGWVLPQFKVHNPLRLNKQILEEKNRFQTLGRCCCLSPRLKAQVEQHIRELGAEFAANNGAGEAARRMIGWGLIPPLQTCVMNEDENLFLALLRVGEDVNTPDSCGRTALHKAAEQGSKRFVEIILQHPDVRTELMTRTGKTAAGLTRNPEILALLNKA